MRFHAVIMAAGLSSRFGSRDENKLLAELEGRPLYTHILEKLIRVRDERDDLDDLTIVCRPGEVYRICRRDNRVMCVMNRHPEDGISGTLKIGLTTVGCLIASEFRAYVSSHGQVRRTPLDERHTMVCFVADEPYLREETIHGLLDGFRASGKAMGAVSLNGRTYNPCCFRDDCWQDLRQLEGDTGGKQLIRRRPEDVYLYDLSPDRAREVEDIDYREDLLR